MDTPFTHHAAAITTIDTGFQRPGLVASHLIVEGDRAALVDVGVAPTLGRVLAALDDRGIARDHVDLVLVTHVHLDHAGAAGVLMRELPNARLVVHPRGARHMIDPSKLIAGATAVYGEAQMRAEFGDILPVPAERVMEAGDGTVMELNGRELLILDTPGHAKHHYCVYDARSRGFFTGDTFGLSYRPFDSDRGAFAFPTTTPVQFDPEAMHASIERLLSFNPECMFLTHFGRVEAPARLAEQLHRHIDGLVALALSVQDRGEDRERLLVQSLGDYVVDAVAEHGCSLGRDEVLALMRMDIALNAQGLVCWLDARAA